MTPDAAADVLQEAHPNAEPYETPWPLLAAWLADAGVDPDDDALVTAVLNAWDVRCA